MCVCVGGLWYGKLPINRSIDGRNTTESGNDCESCTCVFIVCGLENKEQVCTCTCNYLCTCLFMFTCLQLQLTLV